MTEPDPFFEDLMDAIYRLRVAFLKHNMEPPVSIEVGNRRDGDRIRYTMPRDMFLAQPRMGDGRDDAEWVCNVMGVEVRMPAQWRRDQNGRSHLV